jgi:GT2 family glycosyltransferase
LHSVFKAVSNLDSEVFVVDNNSVDGSCAMVRDKFPNVKLIENRENVGFSKANNQAIRQSKAEYVLLLNPDTVVEEDSFDKIVAFMDKTQDAGGLGVKMIDGKGVFLPESKRGLPTPLVAFYKIFGLSSLFPHSKIFSKYHLGYLSDDEIHEIDVLAGAFMLMRKKTLDKVGLLDEDYFMYGEDIDLSYRIIKGGYKNYYYPKTTIIHYKGESTKKGSINYVKVFYNAMIIFANKHFTSGNAKLYALFINFAIYFRAILAIFNRLFKRVIIPVLDSIILYLGFFILAPYWQMYKFNSVEHFPESYFLFAIPIYIAIWIFSVFFSGGYDKPINITKIIRGLLIGTGIILIMYALLPEIYRFSRAMLLIGTLWGIVGMVLLRVGLHLVGVKGYKFKSDKKNKIAIVGNAVEVRRVHDILKQSIDNSNFDFLGFISEDSQSKGPDYLGTIEQIKEIVKVNDIGELIFCSQDISAQKIIKEMLRLEGTGVSYKIAPPQSLSIIGSNSIDTAGDLYTVDFNNITKQNNLRKKRVFDIVVSLFLLPFSPFLLFFTGKKLISNLFSVLFGIKTWVGFYFRDDVNTLNLPRIKKGVISAVIVFSQQNSTSENIEKQNLVYAKNYKLWNDIVILFKGFRFIGK